MSVFRATTLWKKVRQRFLKPRDHEKRGIMKNCFKKCKKKKKERKKKGQAND